jgi:hypothetical protein
MSQHKAMTWVAIGTVLATIPIDIVLLKMDASGELLTAALLLVVVIGSVMMARVIKHYERLDRRREREAKLRLR